MNDEKKQKILACLGTASPTAALRAAGYSAGALRDAGYSAGEIVPDGTPVVERPYSRMLADIEAGRRIHNQKDWGPNEDPGENLCKTPMCVAGHLVNLAGPAGYALVNKIGWEDAATRIHHASRPDVPPPNFGAVPNEWTLAYIRERAAEETKS